MQTCAYVLLLPRFLITFYYVYGAVTDLTPLGHYFILCKLAKSSSAVKILLKEASLSLIP